VAKTTIDISESLLAEAKEVAAREGTTLRALVESGLRTAIDRRLTGLQPEFRDAGWERVRDAAYEGRGA
jgi:Arc/MetJ family transcription regulator